MKRLLLALMFMTAAIPATAKIHRSSAARHRFMVQTGYPHGRKGYVVDHVIPLCAGGKDDPSNMRWMDVKSAKAKDVQEKQLCASLRKKKSS